MDSMETQLFMSHTKRDKDFCDRFDTVAARVGVKVFRSEFETIVPPAWKTIKDEINKSVAMLLLVGKELVKAQAEAEIYPDSRETWKYTHNWIAYEIGLACQQGKDVWVICDNVRINFPVPYLSHYEVWGFDVEDKESLDFWKRHFAEYRDKKKADPNPFRKTSCPYEPCKAEFELYSNIEENGSIVCPTCLRGITYPNGFGPSQVLQALFGVS